MNIILLGNIFEKNILFIWKVLYAL